MSSRTTKAIVRNANEEVLAIVPDGFGYNVVTDVKTYYDLELDEVIANWGDTALVKIASDVDEFHIL